MSKLCTDNPLVDFSSLNIIRYEVGSHVVEGFSFGFQSNLLQLFEENNFFMLSIPYRSHQFCLI